MTSRPIVPALAPNVPRRNRRILQRFGRLGMRLMRWRIDGEIPDLRKFVIVVAPHTSNWDFVVGLCCDLALDMDAVWLGKHSIFVGPFGRWLKSLGGIPVDRSSAHNVVSQVAAEFARRDQMILGLAPEGTRSKVESWRSGYWHIAHAAGVPILPVGFDYRRRAAVIGTPHATSDSLADDEAVLKEFFAGITPRRPELR
ncbi:MAG TPA: lysophospholipid acyltransferase family protein [Gemmatimonadaceae bacterium]